MNITAQNNRFERKTTFEVQKNEKGKITINPKQVDNMSSEEQQKLGEKIHSKLLSGKKLSKREMDYLQQTNPLMYKKALIVEMEREQTKKQLANAKSKKEVRDIQDRKMMQYASEQKALDRTPMSKEAREDTKQFIQMRQEMFKDEIKNFKETGRYKNLPEKAKKENGCSEKQPKLDILV